MKNAIKNFIAASLAATVILGSSIAAKAANGENNTAIIGSVKKINKIAVSGNVEVILIQDVADQVKVYNDYYANNALIQEKDGLLRISSFSRDKLIVEVHVKNLTAIELEDKSSVKTYGSFYLLGLDIALRDQAKADMNINTTQLTVNVGNDAQLSLAGTAEEFTDRTHAATIEDTKTDALLQLYEMATR
ncbi:GIN domain-containing protein [Pedobacter immunditicola]|uniref:GIN domain-containing protein n=1 Tax=Pedobacter immunditicola TaxID=3133440 RepID=UPI0030B5DCDF